MNLIATGTSYPRVAWHTAEAIRDTESSVMVLTGGLGSGKTFSGCVKHLDLVAKNQHSQFSAFFEPIYSKIIDTAIPTFRKVLTLCGFIEDVHYKITTSAPFPKIYFPTSNQEIHLRSMENPERIVAVEYSHVTADELGICKVEGYRNARSRIRCPNATVHQFVGIVTPCGVNWAAEQFDSQTLIGWDTDTYRDHYKEQIIEGRRIKTRRFILWTDDNPYLPDDYLAILQDTYGHNPNLIRSNRYGEFCPLVEGAAYANYFPQKHDLDDREGDPYLPIILKWDFNANPLAWIATQKQNLGDLYLRDFRWIAIHESDGTANQLDDAVIQFSTKFPRLNFADTKIRIFGDRTGHAGSHKVSGSDYENIARMLNELGYRNVEICASVQVAPEIGSVEAVQQLFLQDAYYICRRCRNLRKSLMATTWRKNERKLDKPAGDNWTHWADALKYWAYQEARHEIKQNRIYGINT